jgi:ABC-type multidrug transport system ATPase subunit
MTALESFWFTANLKLSMSMSEKQKRINTLIKDLGLNKCKDTKIGTALVRGVSGGERKRVSIGVELLTDPSLLFLDEPTTGLDSSTSM